MTNYSISQYAGWVAVLLGVVATLAQFRRVIRLGVEGVSLATWVLFALMGCFWISYGVAVRSIEVVLGSLMVLPMQLAIVFRMKPWTVWFITLRSFAFVIVCCVTPTLIWGWSGGVYGTGIAMTVNRGPQIVELIRQEDASGVSVSSWLIGSIGASLWVFYYTGARLWAPLVSTLFAGLASFSIATLAMWRHRQAREKLIAEVVFVP